MSTKDIDEFNVALKEIAYTGLSLDTEYDRVRLCEWLRKLINVPTNNVEAAKLRNDYMQYLKIILRSGMLHGIFLKLPPSGELRPLTEVLGKEIVNKINDLPEVGPIAPYMQYQSDDGKAYVSIKKIKGKGIFCYMAVSPDKVKKN